MADEELAKKEKEETKERTEEEVKDKGFEEVLEMISESDAPFVVHNGFYDLCLLLQHFWKELPETYEEFSQTLRHLFKGGVYDTKHMQQHFYWLFANNLQGLFTAL